MKEEVLPPSPNWFLSNILAHLGDNTIAYGARNWIIIAKFLSENQTPEISTIVNAHKEKVSVLAASPTTDVGSAFWQGLASAGDDSLVKVWNWETLAPIVAHNAHTAGAKVTALDWSKLDSNLVVSADEQGTVVSWDLLSNTTQKYNFLKLVPTCLSCCPHRRDLVAVGTRTGLVCTISLKGKVQHLVSDK
ncbi:Gem-associated protein 5 [Blattella germanica]|nr:Gem-associated protein 5 [Blattella germanica]